jgi:hypothetical protein
VLGLILWLTRSRRALVFTARRHILYLSSTVLASSNMHVLEINCMHVLIECSQMCLMYDIYVDVN